ncbi:hypothetical protein L1049_007891 [Liquidambar formosana]|uniref:Uncharacterized protein n=1 Tax=Liquidambar formosana TaxID=63359 RepID=A0AAP0X529_LIQFO
MTQRTEELLAASIAAAKRAASSSRKCKDPPRPFQPKDVDAQDAAEDEDEEAQYHPQLQLHSYEEDEEGKTILLDHATLAEIFNLPKDGTILKFSTHYPIVHEGYDQQGAIKQIYGNENITTNVPPKAIQLTLTSRIIHSIISYNILPRLGSRSNVSLYEIFIIWCVLNGHRLDLAHIILNILNNCATKKETRGSLPYGMALTTIYNYFNMPLDNEIDFYKPTNKDAYSDATLHMMGLVKNENGEWIRREPIHVGNVPVQDEVSIEQHPKG